MERGYIKLWRKIRDCEVLHERGKVFSRYEAWIDIVMNHAQGKDVGNLKRGEFEVSYRYLAKAWMWDVAKTYRFMDALISQEMLEKLTSGGPMAHFRVVNYSLFNPQKSETPNETPNETLSATANPLPDKHDPETNETLSETPNETRSETNKKNVFNECFNEVESKSRAGAAPTNQPPSPESLRLSEKLREAITARDPRCTAGQLPGMIHRWAKDIDKLLRIDKRTVEECEAVIAWCQSPGCFWGPNVLSGRKLREKFNTIWGQMQNGRRSNTPALSREQAARSTYQQLLDEANGR